MTTRQLSGLAVLLYIVYMYAEMNTTERSYSQTHTSPHTTSRITSGAWETLVNVNV